MSLYKRTSQIGRIAVKLFSFLQGVVMAKKAKSPTRAAKTAGLEKIKRSAKLPTVVKAKKMLKPVKKVAVAAKPISAPASAKPDPVPPTPRVSGRVSRLRAEAAEALSKLGAKWMSLQNKNKNIKAPAYNMQKTFAARSPISHKVLGWGYILSNNNDRLEVLFKDGIKNLISNYKG
jgi:hypothetical protein